MSTDTPIETDQSRSGFFFALSAFTLWGFLPFYMKAVAHLDTFEILAHRVIWSIPIALGLLMLTGRMGDIVRVIRSPRNLFIITASACVISINWGVYVWAIAAERAVETALGYYINPLISVALGVLFLGEKMNRLQGIAIGLAIVAVVIMTLSAGQLPWVALLVAGSFGVYGFIRKTVDIGPTQGFLMEVLLLSLLAIPYFIWLDYSGNSSFGGSIRDTMLLLGCGAVTSIPLILFAYGTKRLQLSTLGLMQYIVPTLIFLIGIFVFNEPFDQWQLIAFILIWAAIILYIWSSVKTFRNQKTPSQLSE